MGNNFWKRAIQKEMANFKVDFEKSSYMVDKIRNGECLPGFQYIGCHVIFDIKMGGNFTRNSRIFAGGYTTDPPASITYSSVV